MALSHARTRLTPRVPGYQHEAGQQAADARAREGVSVVGVEVPTRAAGKVMFKARLPSAAGGVDEADGVSHGVDTEVSGVSRGVVSRGAGHGVLSSGGSHGESGYRAGI
jgi:hypothetical protein